MFIYIVPQESARVVTRFRQFHKVAKSGIRIKIPFIDQFARGAAIDTYGDSKTEKKARDYIVKQDINISLKELVVDFPKQTVITKDNAEIVLDTVVFFHIVDCRKYVYGTENPITSLGYLTKTAIRDIVGSMMMDEVLVSRETMNANIRAEIAADVEAWGIEISRVELEEINVSEEIRTAMNNQMIAERKKREDILLAEAQKESQILRAEAEKQAALLSAQGKKEAAELEAEAYMMERKAEADGIRMINEAAPGQAYLQLKSFDALKELANGTATKIIVPTDLQSIAGVAASVMAVTREN